jgi:hypothetical protein
MQLSRRQADGTPLRAHLQAEARATGKPDPLLLAQVPAAGAALWEAYCELSAMRPSGMGPCAIPGLEYELWQRHGGVRLTPWEIDTLKAMDRAALAAVADAAPKAGQKGMQ